ncbi:MAG: TonB-dependent receptor, partial [Bacteroidota bacterium]
EDDFFTNVERFHDGYKSQMAWVETGFTGTTFADQLFIGFLYSDNYNEIQQPTYLGLPKFPYGEVTQEEEKFIVNFSYNKHGLLDGRLNINSYGVGVFSEEINRDTSSYQYDWFGNRELRTSPNRGEIEGRKTFLILDTENYLGNFNAEYLLSEHHNVAVNYSLNHLILQGSDEFRAQNNTQFSTPNKLTKQVVGLSYTLSLMDGKFKNTVFTKGYAYGINSLETNFQGTETTPFNESKTNLGFGFSSTYQFNKVQVKASYENAIRFPEVIEIFGDGLNNIPNPALQPEKSKNYNLGAIFSFDSSNPFMLSVNGFVRDTEDFIIPVAQGPRAVRINQGKKLSTGLDLNINYQFKKNLIFNVNGTYLDLRDNNKPEEGQISLQYRQRVPNVPYLFGSSSLSYRLDFKNKSALSATVIQNYVHSFFLFWENVGSQDRRTVPDQWSTNLDLVYTLQDGRYNFSIGATNLWDAQLYDNYEQQRPGRAYSFKFRYFIH